MTRLKMLYRYALSVMLRSSSIMMHTPVVENSAQMNCEITKDNGLESVRSRLEHY